MGHRRRLAVPLAIGIVLGLAGCGLQVPADPNGTLERVTDGTLRAGASPDRSLIEVSGDEVSGAEADVVEAFASSLDARVEWTVGSEEQLVTGLEEGDLDLVVGGITDETPWIDRAGVTRGFADMPGADGRNVVMLVPLGENRFLSTLETFLDEELG